jgi:glutathione synthase/RimK-type ligase-like ATP-grasp enzyme
MTPYPAQTRYVKRACAKLGYRFTDLDSDGGYLFAVSDGAREIVSGGGAICTWPLNSAAAHGISRDKHHTNAVLARAGLPVIPGRLFFLDARTAKLRMPGRERADAMAAFARATKPVFCKPNQGSRGDFAEIIADDQSFCAYLDRASARHDAILLQPLVTGDEYRVFCLDGEALFTVHKAEAILKGDGARTLTALLAAHNAPLLGTGVSPLDEPATLASLALRYGLGADDIPAQGAVLVLPGRRNLSAGGGVERVTTNVPPQLARLAVAAAAAIGLRVAGIDIFDTSPAHDLSAPVIIEANGNPGIQALEAAGRDDLIDRIWCEVLTRSFAGTRP